MNAEERALQNPEMFANPTAPTLDSIQADSEVGFSFDDLDIIAVFGECVYVKGAVSDSTADDGECVIVMAAFVAPRHA